MTCNTNQYQMFGWQLEPTCGDQANHEPTCGDQAALSHTKPGCCQSSKLLQQDCHINDSTAMIPQQGFHNRDTTAWITQQ